MHATTFVILILLGQTAAPMASSEDKVKAQSLLKEGATLYEQGNLVDALDKFDQAYAAYPSPKLLFNIGQSARGLGRLTRALEAFQRFLTEATDAPDDMLSTARTSVAELQSKLGRLRIRCTAQGAEITVDGKVVGTTPMPNEIWVTPGSHQIAARHPDNTPSLLQIDVVAESINTVEIAMQPLPLAQPLSERPQTPQTAAGRHKPLSSAARDSLSDAAAEREQARDGWWLGRKWTWVAAGSAVVFAGGATIAGLAMQSKYDSLDRSCGQASASAGASYVGCSESDINQATLRRNVANVLWGMTGAAAITAGALYYMEGQPIQVAPLAGDRIGLVARMAY
jgi:tetratricopeptide (TPR) repeat protein